MQEVHTLTRLGVPPAMVRIRWIFGFQRRRVRRCECETLLPKPGPLPHTSQTEATVRSGGSGSRRSLPDAPARARTEHLDLSEAKRRGGCQGGVVGSSPAAALSV